MLLDETMLRIYTYTKLLSHFFVHGASGATDELYAPGTIYHLLGKTISGMIRNAQNNMVGRCNQ